MRPRPADGGDDAGDIGLVFVSYSHDDAVWAQRFRVLLKPLVRGRHLRLWDDTEIRAGAVWHDAIEDAVRRSRLALVLVSADLLASDYVMDHELPALRRHGVQLAPVLIGACFWEVVPELAAVQWLHDPGRDGPLGRHARNPAERDRWIRLACDRLLALDPELIATVPSPAPRMSAGFGAGPPEHLGSPMGSPTVAPLQEADRVGALIAVPALPPGYVVRDELDTLVAAVVGTGGRGAVGLTAEPAEVGVHGPGGIGKSVLAAAAAADGRIRRRFPDGVYWVTVGEHPDLLALQLDLLKKIGGRSEVRTVREATEALRTSLARRRALVVVDDVWSDAAALAFRVMGPHGRLLYTSRNQAVITAVGAEAQRIGVLSPAAARAVAAEVLRTASDTLPDEADRAFTAVGHVPLAVALLAAAVKGGRSWAEVDLDLGCAADVYGTHPYANTFRALAIGAAALPDDLRTALFGLAVFPPDTVIPFAAIARYWAHTRGRTADETVADLNRLAAANLLRHDGESVGLHDLANEYLLLHADALPVLHMQLLDAYRALLDEPEQWGTLPLDVPYVWDHLAVHLAGAGDRDALVATVTDPAYQARRIARDGAHAAETDLAVAARVTPDDPIVQWWRQWLPRHAHLLSGAQTRVAGTMLAWMEADTDRPAVVAPRHLAPLLPRQYLAARAGVRSESSALVRVLSRHTGGVNAVAWSPDGSHIATGGDDGTTYIWDSATGHPTVTLTGHVGAVEVVAWSPDGTHLATGGWDGTVRICDPIRGTEIADLSGHTGPIHAVAWSPDSTQLATAGDDESARIWSPTTGRVTILLGGHTGAVWTVAWSPDGTHLATGSVDRTARIWNPRTNSGAVLLTGHADAVWMAAWSPDGTHLATASDDRTARVWDGSSGTLSATLTGETIWLYAIAWSSDGARLVTAGQDLTVRIYDPFTGRLTATATGHRAKIRAIAWSPDGTHLATADDGGGVRIRRPANGRVMTVLTGHTRSVRAVAWSPDSAQLATGSEDGTIRIWNTTASPAGGHAHAVLTMAWSADGAHIAIGGDDGRVRIRDLATGTTRVLLSPDEIKRTVALAWCRDGTQLATVGNDGAIRIYDPITGVLITTLGRSHGVVAVDWCPDRPQLAAAGHDGRTRIWNFSTGHSVATLTRHTGEVRAVAWSPDGMRLATGGWDGTARVWDPATGQSLTAMKCGTGPVHAVAWSPDGGRLAAVVGGALCVGDPTTGRVITPPNDHTGWMRSVAWSADGTLLASVDSTGLVIVLNRDLREVASLQLQPSECLAWGGELVAVGQPGGPALITLRDPADLAWT